MANLKIDVDVDYVQSAVQAQVRPAVAEALGKVDVKAMIVRALEAPAASEGRVYGAYSVAMMYSMLADGREAKGRPLLDTLVEQAVETAAKEYVEKAMRDNKALIEDAFMQMMRNSSSKIAKSFAKAISEGLDDDWGFKLDVKVSHTVPARESSYDE